MKTPISPRIPPSNTTISVNAKPSCPQVMLRPVLNESIGENCCTRLNSPRIALNRGMKIGSAHVWPGGAFPRSETADGAFLNRVGHRAGGQPDHENARRQK